MADKARARSGYDYHSMSNLVYTAERSSAAQRAKEPTGEAESLREHMLGTRFGDRARPERPQELQAKLKKLNERKARHEDADEASASQSRRGRKAAAAAAAAAASSSSSATDVLAATEQLETSVYKPRTKQTRAVYEKLLGLIQTLLVDQPHDVLCGAADDVLEILKTDDVTDNERRSRVQQVFQRSLNDDMFNQFVRLGKEITDYGAATQAEAVDDEHGVAVVFGDDESEDEDGMTGEVNEDDSDDEDGEEADVSTAYQDRMDVDGGEEASREARLDPHDIDAFWLQRQLSKYFADAHECQRIASEVLAALELDDVRTVESQLVLLLEYERFDLIKLLTANRRIILYCTKLRRAKSVEERAVIEAEMRASADLSALLDVLEGKAASLSAASASATGVAASVQAAARAANERAAEQQRKRRVLDLEALSFAEGGHLMAEKKTRIPKDAYRVEKKGYIEVHVPATSARPADERKVTIESMPAWAHEAFSGMKSLNLMQSRVYPCAFEDARNMLLCAPTGAGKTNVAMLTVMRELGTCIDPDTGAVRLSEFKVVYVAPMKALVQETVRNFSTRLEPYGVVVRELTGDQQLSRQQIEETNIIVTTPEKWDVVTRKAGHQAFTQLVHLLIVDEIHLLHDDRGPVLEAIIARTIRQVEQTGEHVRIVGLSATLPNYEDVALLIRADLDNGLFVFDQSYRPCPLEQQYIGLTEKKAMKRYNLMNQIVYEKVMERVDQHQVIVFVHSRKETVKTARAIRDLATAEDKVDTFLANHAGSRDVLRVAADEETKMQELKDLLQYGIAVHHAGMSRDDRALVEALFGRNHVRVLVSTATLAWGVNLPARCVIIKGTQVYSPEKGRWVELSHMDVMQMLGRAGRPAYDTQGEGIVITTNQELQYYLALLNESLPVESQLVGKLADTLNSEVVLGSVQNVSDAVDWLAYTYLYIRMLRNPSLYGVTADMLEEDETLAQYRADLVHTAATLLDKSNLINYDRRTGNFQVTDLGRIASYFYITYQSMQTYNEHLKPTMNDIDLLRLFSLSNEFKYINVREEEKGELERLLTRVPVPVKESVDEPTAKVNVLLQGYISQLKMDGFALVSDMVYITQSAGRIMRALFEIVLRRGWAQLAQRCWRFSLMVTRRQWSVQTPLRQFSTVPGAGSMLPEALREMTFSRIEKKDIEWERFYDYTPQELGTLVRNEKLGKKLYSMVHKIPRLQVDARFQPITRSMLRVDLTLRPDFKWDASVHGTAEPFWVFVEDADGERVLHYEYFNLKERFAEFEHTLDFTVPITDPLPPQYFVRVIADRWLGSESVLPVSFARLIPPEKNRPPTDLLDLQPLQVSAFRNDDYAGLYPEIKHFNPIQTQVFNALYTTDENVFVGAPPGSGMTVVAEIAVLRALARSREDPIVYVSPVAAVADRVFRRWSELLGKLGCTVVQLTGDVPVDARLLASANVSVATSEQWDALSRKWRQRDVVQRVQLFVVDNVHLVGGENGPVLEVIVSRMRYLQKHVQDTRLRIVALGASVANSQDIGSWVGAAAHSTFNFHPSVRPLPLDIYMQGFDAAHYQTRMTSMSRPAYGAIVQHARSKPVIVFVASRRQCGVVGFSLLQDASAASQSTQRPFLHCSQADIAAFVDRIQDKTLAHHVTHGVGIMHEGLSPSDAALVRQLFRAGALQVVVAAYSQLWSLDLRSHLVIVYGTEFYDGQAHRYVPYPVSDVLEMLAHANRPLEDDVGKAVILCHQPRKDYLKKFVTEPLPVESHVHDFLADHLNAEVVNGVVENLQQAVDYLTWTLMYRRLTQNPNYYGLRGTSRRHVSDFLSELVEATVDALSECRCLEVDEETMAVRSANAGRIAEHFYVRYTTIQTFGANVRDKMQMRTLLELLCRAAEYDTVPVRQREEFILAKMARNMPWQAPSTDYTDPHTKAFLLLMAHFTGEKLNPEMHGDLQAVLRLAHRLLYALVDVSTSVGLQPTLACMELAQMITQGQLRTDSVLFQVPHFTREVVSRVEAFMAPILKKEQRPLAIFDIVEMEDADRDRLLGMSQEQMMRVAAFCNRYPSMTVAVYPCEKMLVEGERATVLVRLHRDWDDEDEGAAKGSGAELPPVPAPRFPGRKDEVWWLVLGDQASNAVLAIKRFALQTSADKVVRLDFAAPAEGRHSLKVFVMNDSFIGCDQEVGGGDNSGADDDGFTEAPDLDIVVKMGDDRMQT